MPRIPRLREDIVVLWNEGYTKCGIAKKLGITHAAVLRNLRESGIDD